MGVFMEYGYIYLATKEMSTYSRISSKLEELKKQLSKQKIVIQGDLAQFCEEFNSEMRAKDRFVELMAEKYKILPDKIITISKGVLFFEK